MNRPPATNRWLRVRAHAKLNLALRVGAAGDDGFHPLATVFQTVAFGDLLYAQRLDAAAGGRESPLRLRVDGPEVPAVNTVTRAVGLLADEVRAHGIEPAPIAMRLVKRVPQGAGLGGGSSDAVAALGACLHLWQLQEGLLDRRQVLQRIAERVGSDVPFFLVGGTALGTGRGTRIEPLRPLPTTWVVIAMPDVHISTVEAYAAFDRFCDADGSSSVAAPMAPAYDGRLSEAWMGNDLAAPVAVLDPRVEAIGGRLKELGADITQMTGSGAATFGNFANRRAAARAAAALRQEGTWAVATVSITSAQYRRPR